MLLMLLACAAAILPQNGEAARREAVHRLNYFQSYETEVDGRQALRIEVGMDRDNVTYDVTTSPYLEKQLVIDLSNTEPGKLKSDYSFSGKYAKHLHIRELEARHTQIRIDCKNPVVDGSYAVHAEPADRKAKKPYRLVIDIFATGGTGSSSRVAGVSGHSVVIDPGHGGSDTGAVGPTGVTEKSVTLRVALALQKILTSEGATVYMTRTTDTEVSPKGAAASDIEELQARCDVANQHDSDIFISIHMDSFTNGAAKGTTGYYYALGSKKSRDLADKVRAGVIDQIGTPSRGTQSCNFYVVKHTDMPATLVEVAFISNPTEEKLMNSEDGVQKAAQGIADGIADFFG